MKQRRRALGSLILGGMLAMAGCADQKIRERATSPPSPLPSKLQVYVVNYPLQYFAQRIGGEAVEAHFPAPREDDPAFWKPDPEMVADFQQADLILLNGAGYAKWVELATLPPSKMVNTSESFADRYLFEKDAAIHSHGPDGEHTHGEVAFTTWLDPKLAIEQARTIRDALSHARPDLEGAFAERFTSLEKDLLGLDAAMEALVARAPETLLMASHPVYQYLARRYHLSLRHVHFEPDELPDEKEWQQLEDIRAEHPARWMIWEDQPRPEIERRLQEIGLRSVMFLPCANTPAQGDLLTVMKDNLRNLQAIFAAPTAS